MGRAARWAFPPFVAPGETGFVQPARDHMNPRSSSQPTESDSRRLVPIVAASQGWSIARVAHVSTRPAAVLRVA